MSTSATHRPSKVDVMPPARRRLLLLSGAAMGLFAVHALLVFSGHWAQLDHTLMWALHGQATAAIDSLALQVSVVGHQGGVIPLDIALVALLAASRRWPQAAFVLASTVGSGLLNVVAKHTFERARPQLWPHLADEHTWSFPSGHAMGSSTLMLVIIVLCWRGRWRWPVAGAALLFAVLVGVSRPYLGVHWPSDIFAGWLLAFCWVTLMAAWWLCKYHCDVPPREDNP
jgi:membrane-associated phospholipid phosphatase